MNNLLLILCLIQFIIILFLLFNKDTIINDKKITEYFRNNDDFICELNESGECNLHFIQYTKNLFRPTYRFFDSGIFKKEFGEDTKQQTKVTDKDEINFVESIRYRKNNHKQIIIKPKLFIKTTH
jgi:hypothetical protein